MVIVDYIYDIIFGVLLELVQPGIPFLNSRPEIVYFFLLVSDYPGQLCQFLGKCTHVPLLKDRCTSFSCVYAFLSLRYLYNYSPSA